MIDFFRRLFGHSGSSSAAKERLRLVLMTDHLELSPEIVDSMKRDLVDVISRYVEVDREKIDVSFERQDKALAMLANIPIIAVNRSTNGHAAEPVAVAPAAVAAPEESAAIIEPASVTELPPAEINAAEVTAVESASVESASVETPPADALSPEATAPGDLKRRRRRRKRKGATSASATETVSAS